MSKYFIQPITYDGGGNSHVGYTQDDYKSALGRTKNPTNTGNETIDYYNALKNESYKTLLNSEIQASIARDQALKYTNNSLRAKGYATQGMAESTNLGLYSQYQNALSQAANTYNQSVNNIEEQKRNEELAQRKDNFESMTALMSGASDKTQLDNIMSNYGYKVNANGTLDLSNSNLDDNSKKQLQILYSMYNAQFNTTNNLNSLDALRGATYIGKNNTVATLGDHFNEEIKFLWHKGSNGEYQNGEVVQVNNGNGDTIYMEWVGNGFKMINKSSYNSAKNKHKLIWNSNKTITYQ